MNRMKQALAVALSAALMVPSTAFAAGSPVKTGISGQTASASTVYTGTNQNLNITLGGKTLIEGTDFEVVGTKPTNAGTYSITIRGIGLYEGETTINYTITKANKPVMTYSKKTAKALAKGFKAKQLKKTSKKIKLTVKTDNAKKTYKVKGKKAKKWIKVNKKGVVTLKKGIKKGVYKIRVKIKGTKNFKKGTRTIKIVIK